VLIFRRTRLKDVNPLKPCVVVERHALAARGETPIIGMPTAANGGTDALRGGGLAILQALVLCDEVATTVCDLKLARLSSSANFAQLNE